MRNAVTLVTIFALFSVLSIPASNVHAQELTPPPPAPAAFTLPQPPVSRAFQKYQKRPVSELSKLIYLVDRIGESNLAVVYDKNTYPSQLVMPIARWYLNTHYNKKDSAENWLSKWCYRTLGSGETVWVRYEDGSLREARDILLQELDQLDSLCDKDPAV